MHIHPKAIFSLPSKHDREAKLHRVKRRIEASMIHRVVDHTMNSGHHPGLTPDVVRCPGISRWIFLFNHHPIANTKSTGRSFHGYIYSSLVLGDG